MIECALLCILRPTVFVVKPIMCDSTEWIEWLACMEKTPSPHNTYVVASLYKYPVFGSKLAYMSSFYTK